MSIVASICVLLVLGIVYWFQQKETAAAVSAQLGEEKKKQEMTLFVDDLLKESHFKGTVLLVKNRENYYEQAYGYANKEQEIKNSVEMAYPVASVQKSMTAILVEQLVSEGKISYKETLDKFYPDIDYADQITIRDLLNQSSGIDMDEIAPAKLLTSQREQLDFVLSEMTVTEDHSFLYTNANYTLLAGILSMVSGKSYEELFTQRIIQPLHLGETYFWDQLPEKETVPLSYVYEEAEEVDYVPFWDSFPDSKPLFSSLLGAGNLFMSASDLWRVQKAMQNGRLLTEDRYAEMTDIVTEGYSSGLWLSDGQKVVSGSLGGYTTVVYGEETNENLVILISNQQGTLDTGSLAESIYEAMTH